MNGSQAFKELMDSACVGSKVMSEVTGLSLASLIEYKSGKRDIKNTSVDRIVSLFKILEADPVEFFETYFEKV